MHLDLSKCDFFNFSDSFFADQLNLENQYRFDPLAKDSGTKTPQTGSIKDKFISGLKFASININSIRGKKLELLAFLDFHQPQIVAIQETKIDSSISTLELFPESCTEKIEPLLVAVLCNLSTRIFCICQSQNWKMTRSQFG